MVININPSRINTSSGSAGRAANRRPQAADDVEIPTPSRAQINFIPSPESLRTLIAGAVSALRKGVRWDRGTILNLLV